MKPVTSLSREKVARGTTPRNRTRGLQESLSRSPAQTKATTTTTPPPAATRQQGTGTNTNVSHSNTPTNNEIYWEPPASFKRSGPATPSKATKGDMTSPYGKTRRLLPPSRRVDEGDDEMKSPPKLLRRSRTAVTTTRFASKKYVASAPAASMPAMGTPTRPTRKDDGGMRRLSTSPRQRTPEGDSPAAYESSFFSPESHGMHPWDESFTTSPSGGGGASSASASAGSKLTYPRLESVRSIASWSMASQSTQAELEFYQIEQRSSALASGVVAPPPLWVTPMAKDGSSALPGTSGTGGATAGLSATQHRRNMLAKSTAGMLRSTRPVWDRSESIQSFGSHTSSMWSVGGMSRTSSRKSVYSWNTTSRTSPPDYLRATSSSTYGKPRSIISPNHLADAPIEAHRPIPSVLKPASALDSQTEFLTTKPSYPTHYGGTGPTSSTKPSLLEDDYGSEDLWSKPAPSSMLVSSIAALDLSHQIDHDEEDDEDYDGEEDTVAALADKWDPQPGGSFMTYHSKYY